ncbi:hypothetical protein EG68_03858 [Paragonimus skrjabini miyazakii]|uniref:Uncharacterized protein n=1 Tax=Paragonimus skrjabini miyazakii TaxID=59628 RepID=A0A8S9Z0H3_9TREM|nr:hypothetical protein EG68_03858 [Paragonimus skrjabini miyazakii]
MQRFVVKRFHDLKKVAKHAEWQIVCVTNPKALTVFILWPKDCCTNVLSVIVFTQVVTGMVYFY